MSHKYWMPTRVRSEGTVGRNKAVSKPCFAHKAGGKHLRMPGSGPAPRDQGFWACLEAALLLET